MNGAFIPRNFGVGSDSFSISARLSRSLSVGRTRRLEAVAEVFNLTNRRNVLTRNTNFGSLAYPDNPSAMFGRITAVGDPRTVQFALRLRF